MSAAGLAELVRAAALHDTSLDTGGILWLEHVNLVVGNRAQAEHFYVAFLGCTADPSPSFHVNLGRQQFHLSEGDAQVLTGSFGIAVPSLDTVRSRAAEAAAALQGTHFAFRDHGHALEATCPWGNTFFLYAMAVPAEAQAGTAEHAPKLVRRQAGFDHGLGVLGDQPGIRFIEVRVPSGAARRVGRFYEEMLGAHVVYAAEGKGVVVALGPNVHAVITDIPGLGEGALARMKGVHLCIYIVGFRQAYERLQARSLIWTNPRFVHLDTCDTWEQASASRQFRFRAICDPDRPQDGSGAAPLLELEHETRACRHFQFMKTVEYRAR
jgi:catechol 2,3-dioxygenase-like lactoylglutathione lyase family enzyme